MWAWTWWQILGAIVFLAWSAADIQQTYQIANAGREANPFLGKSPTRIRIWVWFVVWAGGLLGIAWALPIGWRDGFLLVSTSIEAANVGRNAGLGWSVLGRTSL